MFLAYGEAKDNHFPMKAHDKDPVRVRIFGSKQLALFPRHNFGMMMAI
jgi:hypothetical protein